MIDLEYLRADLAEVDSMLAELPPTDVITRRGLEYRRRQIMEELDETSSLERP